MNRRELFKGASGLALLSTLPAWTASAQISGAVPASEVRDTLSLDKGWRFFEGDIPFPEPIGNSATYDSTKTGAAGGAAALNFDDTEWTPVTLPHDFVSFQPIENGTNVAQGFRKRGIAVLVGDWTDGDPALGRFIAAHNRAGVPLYLYYPPGAAEPRVLPQILTPGLLTGL